MNISLKHVINIVQRFVQVSPIFSTTSSVVASRLSPLNRQICVTFQVVDDPIQTKHDLLAALKRFKWCGNECIFNATVAFVNEMCRFQFEQLNKNLTHSSSYVKSLSTYLIFNFLSDTRRKIVRPFNYSEILSRHKLRFWETLHVLLLLLLFEIPQEKAIKDFQITKWQWTCNGNEYELSLCIAPNSRKKH